MEWIIIFAETILAIGVIIFVIGYLLFKIIPLSIRLLRIRIKKAKKYVEEYEAEEKRAKQHKKQHNQWTDDWLHNATARQNNRYEYTDPSWAQKEKKWSPTGWYYDEEKEKWIPPDYLDSRKNTKIHNYQVYTQAEQDKHIRLSKDGPTFEEWKAARMKDEQEKLR